jgi:hypothetical protein
MLIESCQADALTPPEGDYRNDLDRVADFTTTNA